MIYSKFCIICSTEYESTRRNSVFCSKKCNNRARYLPEKLLNELIARNARFTMSVANTFTKSIVDTRFSGYAPKGATKNNPLGEDEALLIAHARSIAESRGINVPSGQSLEEINKNRHPVDINKDTEMMSFKLPDIPETEDHIVIKHGLRKLGGGK